MKWEDLDIPMLGRAAGAIILGLGLILALWGAFDSDLDGGTTFRFFLNDVLGYLAFGAVVILASEILDRLIRRGTSG